MALKDSCNDVSGTHPFGVLEEEELDAVLLEEGFVDPQAIEVRRTVVLVAADRVDDVVRTERREHH